MKKLLLLLPFLASAFCCPAVELVRDGQPAAEIAIPAAAVSSVQFAAQELRDHIRLITGAELPLVKADAPRRLPNRIHLGYGAPPQDSGAFAGHIRAAGPDLFLHGNDREIPENNLKTPRGRTIGWSVISSGTLISVYDFLDRDLHVRFRRPGPEGTFVTPQKNLRLPDFDRPVQLRLISCDFAIPEPSRRFRTPAYDTDALNGRLWQLRHRMVNRYWFQSGHAFTRYWQRFGKTHPEYFAMLPDGSRRNLEGDSTGVYTAMCVSDPGFIQQIVADYRRSGTPDWLGISENDSPGMCCCPRCRAWDSRDFSAAGHPYWEKKTVPTAGTRFSVFALDEGGADRFPLASLTDRYARFALAVQQEAAKYNPNVHVSWYAYANYVRPPREVKLNPNILVGYVGTPFFPLTEERMKDSEKEWNAWAATGCSLFFRPNTTWSGSCFPLQYGERFAREYRRVLASPSLQRVHFDALRGEFANQGPMWYLLARLSARPELDMEVVLAEYYEIFGAAAPAVREYFQFWTKISDAVTPAQIARWEQEAGYKFIVWMQLEVVCHIFRPEQFAQAAKLLDKAERAADTVQSRREIAFLKLGLEHARLTLLMGQAHLARVHNNSAENQRDFQRKYEALMKFRKTHESSGISWMSILNSFEDYNFYCSLNGKK